jgi:hypothetical protein
LPKAVRYIQKVRRAALQGCKTLKKKAFILVFTIFLWMNAAGYDKIKTVTRE